jgi:ABC-type transport system substrate-binding protein
MSRKIFVMLVVVMSVALLAGCAAPAAPAAPQVVKETVVVKETSIVKETSVVEKTVIAKETVVVEATPAAPVEEKSDVQELRVIEMADWNSAFRMNPYQFGSGGAAGLMWMRMVGMADNFEGEKTARGLAESWEFNEDRTSVTLKLKKDQKFSDGTPITAKEAAWSLGYLIMTGHPDLKVKFSGSSAPRYFGALKGAQEVFDGKVPADEFGAAMVEGIKVIDDSTIQLDFTQPVMTLTVEPLQFWMILKPESVMAGKGKEYGPDAYWTTEPGVVSSGPFMLDSFASGNGYTMVPNPNWAGKKPELSKIIVTLMTDYSTALSAYENKEADAVMMPLGPEDAQAAESSEFLKSSLKPAVGYDLEHMLISAFKPMEDVNVRRAIAMAIDKQALADVLGGGAGQTGFTVLDYHHIPGSVPTCNEQFAKVQPLKYDPAAAKAELAKSPYADKLADMEFNITLGMWGEPVARNLVQAQVLQKMLQDNLGMKNIVIHQEPMADYTKPTYPTHFWPNSQGEHTMDVYTYMNNLVPLSQPLPADEKQMTMLNLPYVPELAAKMKEASEQTDPVKMCEKLAEAQQMWVDNVFSLDLFVGTTYRLQAPWVQNLNLYGPARPSISEEDGKFITETYIVKH